MAYLKNPYFARASSLEVLQQALDDGVFKDLDRIAYVLLDNNKLVHVSVDKVIRPIVGDNKEQIQFLSSLPPVSEADPTVVYIVGTTAYTFDADAQEFKPTYYEVLDDIDALSTRMDAVEAQVQSYDAAIQALEQADQVLSDRMDAADTAIINLTTVVNDKADKATTLSGYGITDAYTSVQVDQAISDAMEWTWDM